MLKPSRENRRFLQEEGRFFRTRIDHNDNYEDIDVMQKSLKSMSNEIDTNLVRIFCYYAIVQVLIQRHREGNDVGIASV